MEELLCQVLLMIGKGRKTAFGQFGQRSVSGGQGVWKTKSPVAKSMALAMNTHNT